MHPSLKAALDRFAAQAGHKPVDAVLAASKPKSAKFLAGPPVWWNHPARDL